MIYNEKHAIFVALAGLFTSATAAPAHHAKSGHTSELISPGRDELGGRLGRMGRIDLWRTGVTKENLKTHYPDQCLHAWNFFNGERCWCFTGCALDCNHGGWKVDPRRGKPAEPGVSGKDLNPEMCEGLTAQDQTACEEMTCDLMANCKDVPADLAPGLDMIESTGGYQCASIQETYIDYCMCGSDCAHGYGMICPIIEISEFEKSGITDDSKFDVLLDGKTIFTGFDMDETPFSYSHNGVASKAFCIYGDAQNNIQTEVFDTTWMFLSADPEKAKMIPRIDVVLSTEA